MTVTKLEGGYEIDDDMARIDVDVAHAYMGGESYWAQGRTRQAMQELVFESTRVVGLYASDGTMVGFARVLSDRHTFAYLADVFVLEAHRGKGLGFQLTREAIEGSAYPDGRWILSTLDAHELYGRLGFGKPTFRMMERRREVHADDPEWDA